MNAARKLAGMKACIADYKVEHSYLEEFDGSLKLWSGLSPEAKLAYLARDAALFELSQEQFAQVIRDELRDLPSTTRENALLRLVLDNAKETREVERQIPDDGRTDPAPLALRLRDLLSAQTNRRSHGPESSRDRGNEM